METKQQSLGLRLTSADYLRVLEAAENDKQTLSQFVLSAIKEKIEREERDAESKQVEHNEEPLNASKAYSIIEIENPIIEEATAEEVIPVTVKQDSKPNRIMNRIYCRNNL